MAMPSNPDSTNESAGIEHLYRDYQRPILAYLIRLVGEYHTAEDLCQETFLKVLRGWSGRDPRASITAWLYRIATNTAYDHLRRCRRVGFAPLFEAEISAGGEQMPDLATDADRLVREALEQLPPRYRVPLVLHICQEQSMREIAEVLGCSSSAVKMRLFRARARFRQIYGCS